MFRKFSIVGLVVGAVASVGMFNSRGFASNESRNHAFFHDGFDEAFTHADTHGFEAFTHAERFRAIENDAFEFFGAFHS